MRNCHQNITTQDFTQALFNNSNEGYIEITYISPPELGLFGPIVGWVPLPLRSADVPINWITTMNTRGYGAYYGLAVRGIKHEPVEKISPRTQKPSPTLFSRVVHP